MIRGGGCTKGRMGMDRRGCTGARRYCSQWRRLGVSTSVGAKDAFASRNHAFHLVHHHTSLLFEAFLSMRSNGSKGRADFHVVLPYERRSIARFTNANARFQSTETRTTSNLSDQHLNILEHHRIVHLDGPDVFFIPSLFGVEKQVRSRPLSQAAAAVYSFVKTI